MARMAVLFMYAMLLSVTVGSRIDTDRHTFCQTFISDEELHTLIKSVRGGAEPCPCIEQKIKLDNTFEKTGQCYRQWFFQKGVKQICCYSATGNLIIGGPSSGYVLLEGKEYVIERAHADCCGNESTIYTHYSCRMFNEMNPTDNCSAYIPPSVVTSSGDPLIKTIDGNTYDFNGHGEYVFLTDNTTFEIQARTGYVVKGNNDATMFTAFALFDKQNGEQIELHYDRDSKDIRFYRNGTYNEACNASSMKGHGRPYPCEMPSRYSCLVLAGGGQIIVQHCGFRYFANAIFFKTDNLMSIEIVARNVSAKNLTGLAGHQVDVSYIMRNTSRVPIDASASELFDFGESWSLQTESESLFKYYHTGGNFTIYNNHHTRPKFLEIFLGNLTALFKGFSEENITTFNNTCRNYWNDEPNEQCLLTVARTGDYSLGEAVMAKANSTHYNWMILHNKPPKFRNDDTDENIQVIHNDNWTFNFSAQVEFGTQHVLIYEVHTDIPKKEYNLTSDGIFTWKVGTGLREKGSSVIFTATDRFNGFASKEIRITYCGCETADECDFKITQTPIVNSLDGFMRAGCNCPEYYTGDFCEIWNDPCKTKTCFDNGTCNGNVSRQKVGNSWPCAQCKPGRVHKGFTDGRQNCSDVDECVTGLSKCQQKCTNTNGSYVCNCTAGYELNSDMYSCTDVDECYKHLKSCANNEVCVNTAGSATCYCAPGFTRNTQKGSCDKIGKLEDLVHVMCNSSKWDIRMDFDSLQTIYPGIRASDIYLGETQCNGKAEGYTLNFSYNISSCKTTEMTSGNTHIFRNKLFYVMFDPEIPFLIRRHVWTFAVECDVIRGGTGTSHLHHGIETHHATYVQHYNVTVELYSDQNFQHPINGGVGVVHVGEDVYVKVSTTMADWNTKMRLQTCFTRPNNNAERDMDVVLINNGCEVDSHTHIISQSTHETKFVFQDFEYLTNDEGLDIYCNATFCDSKDYSSDCVQICHQGTALIG